MKEPIRSIAVLGTGIMGRPMAANLLLEAMNPRHRVGDGPDQRP